MYRTNKRGVYPSGYGNPVIRFWKKVNKQGLIHPVHGRCWMWMGSKVRGYGQHSVDEKNIKAHRYSYELHVEKIPSGLSVLHRCDNPACVNPNHLFVGTTLDNNKDMESKGRHPHKRYALTEEQAAEVRRRYQRYSRPNGSYALAKEFKVSQTTIWTALGKR